MHSSFRQRVLTRQPLHGTLVSLGAPDVVEIVAGAGFDFLFLDGEHGAHQGPALPGALRAAGTTPCLVRTPPGNDAAIAHALDAGAAGVIVPQVHSGAQAEHAARLAHYPPAGARGVGPGRASGYGARPDYLSRANDEVVVVVQAESAAALADIRAIARAPGVDAVLIGPHDLAASLGHLGEPGHPDVQGAIGTIVDACLEAARTVGIFGGDAESVRPWIARGVTLVTVGVDTALLSAAARALLASVRDSARA